MRKHLSSSSSIISAASTSVGKRSNSQDEEQLFFVTSYSNFDKLAHGPRGTEATHSLYIYSFHPSDGSLVLLNVQGSNAVLNPAFTRYHPKLNVVYTCTEDIEEEGLIYSYKLSPDGQLIPLDDNAPIKAGGTSTCYLTIDREQKHMLAVNYWNSTLAVIPMDPNTGALGKEIKSMYDPKGGKKMVAAAKKDGGVNHSCNDTSTIQQRQADPHSHALVLDPFVGTIAYVPDLGKDVIREFLYNSKDGKIECEMNMLPSGLCTGHPDGPRYLEFHPRYNVAYVVNELSSTVAVFEVDRDLLQEIDTAVRNGEDSLERFRGRSTLRLIQSIRTIPNAFPNTLNTCGRICVHQSGRFVVVSNRGHQSICVYKVMKRGRLDVVGHFHTRGETPRHFQFDHSGQYLLVANQDTDSLAVFSFNLSTGQIQYTGNEYRVPSPNFVCCCPMYQNDDEDDEVENGITNNATIADVVASGDHEIPSSVRPHPELVVGNNTKNMNDGNSSDSDDSTIRTDRPLSIIKPSLEEQLKQAQEEIQQLRAMLLAKNN